MSQKSTLRGKRILVTGATGFIGGRLAERLVHEHEALVTGAGRNLNRAQGLAEVNVRLCTLDLTKPDLAVFEASISEIIQGQDTVFHLAAAMGRQARDPSLAEQVNVTATETLVRAAAAAGVSRFVQVSSMSAYGPPDQIIIDEGHPLATDQIANYGRTKAIGEQRAMAVANELGLEATVVRPGMVYGPGSQTWTVNMIRLLQRRVPIIIAGGTGHAQPVYIDNLVDLLILAASRPEAAGQAFNGIDQPLPWRDFFGYYGRMCDRRPWGIPLWLARFALEIFRRISGRSESARTLLSFYTAQAVYPHEKARRLLGYEPQVSIEEGMARTEYWLRQAGYLPAKL